MTFSYQPEHYRVGFWLIGTQHEPMRKYNSCILFLFSLVQLFVSQVRESSPVVHVFSVADVDVAAVLFGRRRSAPSR